MRILRTACLCLIVSYSYAQEVDSASIQKYASENAEHLLKDLPDGIYNDGQSLVNKKPSNNSAFTKSENDGGMKFSFYYAKNKKRIKKAFAIVYKGEVFFQTKSMLRYATKDSRGLSWDGGPYFVKAHIVGHFLFAEDYFTPASAGLIGGIIAMAATRKLMPIIFISHLQKFRLIKSYDHLKVFVESKYPEYGHLVKSKREMKEEASTRHFVEITKEIIEKIK